MMKSIGASGWRRHGMRNGWFSGGRQEEAMLHAQPSTLQHVLLVEDDRDLRATLALLLSEAGYQVHLASSLDEAHIQVERRSFALVLVGIYIDYAQHQLARLRELR